MAFNSTQNNGKDNSKDVNTRGLSFFNKEGFDPSCLSLGMWNEMISIRIVPAFEKSKQTQQRVFDYDKTVSTALTVDKVMLLIFKTIHEIYPAIDKGENKTIGVPVGGDGLIVIGTGVNLTGNVRPFIGIHKALDENAKKPEFSIYYEFNRSTSVDDFNPETGSYTVHDSIHSELHTFIELLKAIVNGLSNGTAHSIRAVNRWHNEKTVGMLEEIVNKLGISSNYTRTNTYSNRNTISWGTSNNTSHEPELEVADVESMDNINAIAEFLN